MNSKTISYNKENISILKKKERTCIYFLIFSIALLVLLVTLSLVYTNYDNYIWFETLGTIGVAILTLILVYLVFRLVDIKRVLGHFDAIINEKTINETIVVTSFSSKPINLDDSTKVYEIKAKNSLGNEKTYYVLSIFGCDFQVDKTYEVVLASNFIKEVKDEL